jgi:hypothetical protein
MFKYLAVAVVLAATYKLPYSVEAAAAILSFFATTFYVMTFRLFTGLNNAQLSDDVDILKVITIYMIYISLGAIVFLSQYQYIAFFALPWLGIQLLINALSILVKLDIIGIKNK